LEVGVKMACLHDHSCEDHDCSSDWSLYKHIDLDKVSIYTHQNPFQFFFNFKFLILNCDDFQVSALNEATPGTVKSVFKAWEHRLNTSGVIYFYY
jgi:hypothetical protein